MSLYRNKEGYYDPTAGAAVKKVERQQKKVRKSSLPLVYRFEEIPSFKAIKKVVR